MATVYLETTIISYLAAKPSRDVVTAGHQQTTHDRDVVLNYFPISFRRIKVPGLAHKTFPENSLWHIR